MAVHLRHRDWQVAYVSGRRVASAGHRAILGPILIRFVYQKDTVSRCTGEERRKLLNLANRLKRLRLVRDARERGTFREARYLL